MNATRLPLAALLLLAGPARAGSLEDAVAKIVEGVKARLAGKGQKVTLGTFAGSDESHVALHSSAGSAIAFELKRQLTRQDIEVQRISEFTLSGTFIEAENNTGRQKVEIQARLYDRVRRTKTALSAEVTNEVSVAHLLGVPVQYPDGAKETERIVALQTEVDRFLPDAVRKKLKKPDHGKPSPTLDGALVRPGKGSKFAIEVLVAPPEPAARGKPAAGGGAFPVYQPRRPADDGGLAFVELKRGERYAVRLVNGADYDMAVSLTIDGLSVFAACDREGEDPLTKTKVPLRDVRTGKPRFGHFIVPRGKSVLVRGWFVNLEQSDEFQV